MKIFISLITFFTISLGLKAQTYRELSFEFSNSIFMKNRFAGTSQVYPTIDAVYNMNVKCTNIAGLQIGFGASIGASKWRILFGYEKKWLTYQGYLILNNPAPNPTNTGTQDIQLKNQINIFNAGIGYDFTLLKSKLKVRPFVKVLYRSYRDKDIYQIKNLDYNNKNLGDYGYKVTLSKHADDNLAGEIGIQFSYQLTSKLQCFTNFCYSNPLQVNYTSYQKEIIAEYYNPTTGVISKESLGVKNGGWRIKTTNAYIGLGMKYIF